MGQGREERNESRRTVTWDEARLAKRAWDHSRSTGDEEEGPAWEALTLAKDRKHTHLPCTLETSAAHPYSAYRFETWVLSPR